MPKQRTKTRSQVVNDSMRKIYDDIKIRIRKDGGYGFTVSELRDAAESAGESMSAFIIQAIRERLDQLR